MLMFAAIAVSSIASAASGGTSALRRSRAATASATVPTSASTRNGMGVFTPRATGKKNHRPSEIGSPSR